ncbi:MAG: BRCT domain-containing protein, partial [Anaerolineales bacterium]
ELLAKLRSAGVWPVEEEVKQDEMKQVFAGKTFVVTGGLQKFTREEVKEFIEKRGGKVTESVSKKTDYVLVGQNPGSKLEKARALNIPILDETQFLEMAEK